MGHDRNEPRTQAMNRLRKQNNDHGASATAGGQSVQILYNWKLFCAREERLWEDKFEALLSNGYGSSRRRERTETNGMVEVEANAHR